MGKGMGMGEGEDEDDTDSEMFFHYCTVGPFFSAEWTPYLKKMTEVKYRKIIVLQ